MSHSKRAIMFFLIACSPACGRQVVHFVADAGPESDANSGGGGVAAPVTPGSAGGAGHAGGAGGIGHVDGGGGAGHNGGGASGSAGLDAHPTDGSMDASTAACRQTTVDLRSAAGFAVLGGSTVTNGGPTMVAGDLGLSPGTAITGFPPGVVVGTQHAGDPTAAQGIADLVTAYNDAKGRTLCPVTVSGNLGGLTLAPGLYMSTSSLEISSGI